MKRSPLLLTILILTGVIAIELYPAAAPELETPDSVDGDVALPTSAQDFVAPDVSEFTEVLKRPLFFNDRKLPPEPTPQPVATAPRLPLRLLLEGVAITSDSRVAVLRNTSNNQLLQLTEGMSHDGWLLESVNSAAVTFKRGTEVSELVLDPDAQNGRR